MVLCVALVVRGLLFLFQFRPKFGPIPDQLLFYRLCLSPVALPFSCSVVRSAIARSALTDLDFLDSVIYELSWSTSI